MIHAVDPSSQRQGQGNPHCLLSQPYEQQLKARVLSSAGNLTPNAMLALALDTCGNNYPLAVLTVHNLLKEITYQGRQNRDKLSGLISRGRAYTFPADIGNFASRLVNLRTKPGDKMGIWYHSFVPLNIAAWTDYPSAADMAITQEYTMRALGQYIPALGMNSPVDNEKKGSDRQFAQAARVIHEGRPKQPPAVVVCNGFVTPERGKEGTEFKLKLAYQVQRFPANQTVSVREAIDVTRKATTPVSHSVRTIHTGSTRTAHAEFTYIGTSFGRHAFQYILSPPGGAEEVKDFVPFEVIAGPQTGLIRQDPVLQIHRDKSPYEAGNASFKDGDSSLTMQYDVPASHFHERDSYKTGVVATTTCTCQVPATLEPNQRFVLKVDCQSFFQGPGPVLDDIHLPKVELDLPWCNDPPYGQMFNEQDNDDINKHLKLQEEYTKISGVKRSFSGNWAFGKYTVSWPVVYVKPDEGTPPPYIGLIIHDNSGIADRWASLTWRYVPPEAQGQGMPAD